MAKAITLTITRELVHKELCRGFSLYLNHSYGSSPLSHIIDKLPKGVHRERVILWIETFSSLRLIEDAPAKFKRDKEISDDYEGAIRNPYWTMELEKTKQLSTVNKLKSSLLAGIHSFISDPSDTNYKAVVDDLNAYKQFGISPVKKKLTIAPAKFLQGGLPS